MKKPSYEKIEHNIEISNVMVIGSGYVGLTTAALFAEAGFKVTSVDIKAEIVNSINNGKSPIAEPGLQELVSRNVKAGRLTGSLAKESQIKKQDAILICVQTPIDSNNVPKLTFLMNAVETVARQIKPKMLVVICSTIPPGTIRNKVKPIIDSCSDLVADKDYYLAFVPERIAPGKALYEFVENPRVVGGIGPNSTKIAAELFNHVCKKIITTDVTTAEIAKIAENTYRDINIAYANQLALICEKVGADVISVIQLANTHPRVNIHRPGPGVGGPCLTKDPYLLLNGLKNVDQSVNLIRTARMINDQMPDHVIELTVLALKDAGKQPKGSKVAVLGSSYKAEVDDSRCSPSEPIIRGLSRLGVSVIVYDPYSVASFGAKKVETLQEVAKNTDCLIFATDHPEFKQLNLTEIKNQTNTNCAIVDARRMLDPYEAKKAGFNYYGIGYKIADYNR